MTAPPPPDGLTEAGRRIWESTTAEFKLSALELRILEDICREVGIVDRLEREVVDVPSTSKGSMGQVVAAPQLVELRQHRALLGQLFSRLKIPAEDQGEDTGSVFR